MKNWLVFIQPYLIFSIPIFIGISTQVIKYILYSFKHGWDLNYAFTHGHMPSAHTSFIVSLSTCVGYYEGVNSGAFAIAIALSIIIIDDAVRLRVYMGDQGRFLNMLIRQLPIDKKKFPRFKERVGHRVSEVIIGGIYGFSATMLIIKLLSI